MSRPDSRPSLFQTFRFSSFDESAAFLTRIAQDLADETQLIQAKVRAADVRVRVDPHPVEGKEPARRVMARLREIYQGRP